MSMLVQKESRGSLAHDIHMFVNRGNVPPTSYMTMSWGFATEYGLIFTCFRGDGCFAEGSNYTFLLSAPVNTVGKTASMIISQDLSPFRHRGHDSDTTGPRDLSGCYAKWT